jgi:hypothetical protein
MLPQKTTLPAGQREGLNSSSKTNSVPKPIFHPQGQSPSELTFEEAVMRASRRPHVPAPLFVPELSQAVPDWRLPGRRLG